MTGWLRKSCFHGVILSFNSAQIKVQNEWINNTRGRLLARKWSLCPYNLIFVLTRRQNNPVWKWECLKIINVKHFSELILSETSDLLLFQRDLDICPGSLAIHHPDSTSLCLVCSLSPSPPVAAYSNSCSWKISFSLSVSFSLSPF